MKWKVFALHGEIITVDVSGNETPPALPDLIGGTLEVCTSGPGWTLWGHGEGRCEKQPINLTAMRFVAAACDCSLDDITSLHGVLVLTGDDDGETVGVPDDPILERLCSVAGSFTEAKIVVSFTD